MNNFYIDPLSVKPQDPQDEEPKHVSPESSKLNAAFKFIWEVIKVVIISLAIIIPVRMFVVQPFIVEGESMIPNFHDGEYLIVDEISLHFKKIERGDIVIFHPPTNPDTYYIKRVIALPGESIEIKNGSIYIYNKDYKNGLKLNEEDYLPGNTHLTNEISKIDLTDAQYYLIGDHRLNSSDSRTFGPVPESSIKGRVLLRAYPFKDFTFINAPEY